MDMGLTGRSVLVTGGTRGIGRALALAYAGEGARVAITYASDEAAASETVAMLRAKGEGSSASFHLDLEDSASIEAAVQGAVEAFGGLDVLVANAVRWPVDARAPLVEVDRAGWTRALRANLEGTALTLRVALPHLVRSRAGRIVLISSGVARQGMAGATAYSRTSARRSRVRARANTVGASVRSRRRRQGGPPARIPSERQNHRRIPPGRRRYRLASSGEEGRDKTNTGAARYRPTTTRTPTASAWRGQCFAAMVESAMSTHASVDAGPRRRLWRGRAGAAPDRRALDGPRQLIGDARARP